MGNLPLHPMVVHFPLVLALVLPAVIAVLLWREWRGRLAERIWWIATLVAGLLTVGALAALATGEDEEDRVEAVVPEAAFETHEEGAETFLWATVLPLALLTLTALARRPRVRRWAGTGAVVASLAVAGLAVRVGHSGGQLVYRHNAGSAYIASPSLHSERQAGQVEDD